MIDETWAFFAVAAPIMAYALWVFGRKARSSPLCPRCDVPGRMWDPMKVCWTCPVCQGWFNADRPSVAGWVLYPGTGGQTWKTPEAEERFQRETEKIRRRHVLGEDSP